MLGEQSAKLSTDSNRPCSLHAWDGFCLLELLPSIPCPRYRYRAQVRHVDGREGEVGIYFASSTHSSVDGSSVHGFSSFSFNDLTLPFGRLPAEGNEASLNLQLYW